MCKMNHRILLPVVVALWGVFTAKGAPGQAAVTPVVEVEEEVYSFKPADNGAGPMWCHGSTCLVRDGERVLASGIETLAEAKPLNNCRWLWYERDRRGWSLARKDELGRTREPCPLAVFPGRAVFLSANPTLAPGAYSGPARPEILALKPTDPAGNFTTEQAAWDGAPAFTEHSYRSFAADGPGGELVLLQNIGYTHAEWSLRASNGAWTAHGKLPWPKSADSPKAEPIRVCYPTVALRNRAVHFCGVSDIIEPNLVWRAFKKQLTGRDWDYDFRRLFYTWTPDIAAKPFAEWVEVASREATCGWIMPQDLWLAPDGAVHLLWTERALDERLREKFFPKARQSHALNYAVVRQGAVALRRSLVEVREGEQAAIPGAARFHITPDHRLLVFYSTSGGAKGTTENRLMEMEPGGGLGPARTVPLRKPFVSFFTATPRAGSAPSRFLDLLGQRAGEGNVIAYARVRLD
jgi:hypothetical protein